MRAAKIGREKNLIYFTHFFAQKILISKRGRSQKC